MIAIWGANSFIGRHLTQLLSASGEDLKLFARDFEGFPFPLPQTAQTFAHDFGQPGEYLKQMHDCRAVVFLVNDPHQELALQAKLYRDFFEVLGAHKSLPERIVYISSGGAIYGVTGHAPVTEGHQMQPISAYGQSKLAIEKILINAAEHTSWDYSILRVANPVGRWNKKINLIDAAFTAATTGQPLTVWGDGSAVRDYFDVGELAQAVTLAITKPQAANAIFNVGSGAGHSVNEVLELVKSVTGNPVPVQYQLPPRPADVPYNVLDCGLIQTTLGWKAEKTLKDIVTDMGAQR